MSDRRSLPWIALGFLVVFTGASPEKKTLEIFFIDVQGGAATLIVTPERESILIDSGWAGEKDRDPARIEDVVKNVAGLDRIDHLITTHWHADHFGGIAGLTTRLPIGRFWDRGLPDPSAAKGDRDAYPDGPGPADPLGIAYRKASAGKRQTLKAGNILPLQGEIQAQVLASGGQVIDAPTGPLNPLCAEAPADLDVDPSDNARSLALRFRFGSFDFLDCGDLTWNIEKRLVCPVDRIGPIDLFQVTHHGAPNSNHPTLVRTIAPTVTVMNNGPKKGGDPKTVRLLKSIPSIQAAYQLHKNAATPAESNTDPALIANSDPAGGQFIRVTIAADGARFTVRIGANGQAREFVSK